MCRFVAYAGKPILLEEVLYKPKNSLIKQSIRAKEMEEPLNGDGFGLGWYAHEIGSWPGLFVSTQPAWNDQNLLHIAPKIRSSCFFAHVRAASIGSVSLLNCHPFYYNRWMFMHNGSIGGFVKIKRHLRRELSDEIYNWIQGQTDSEHFFALFLNILLQKNRPDNAETMALVMEETIRAMFALQRKYNVRETSYLTLAITDGKNILAMRYISNLEEMPPSLHYSVGSDYGCDETGACHMHSANGKVGAVLIASEKLSSYRGDWKTVPPNYMLLVNKDLSHSLKTVDVYDES